MNVNTRTYNVIKNIVSNFGTEAINIILKFLTRIIFIKVFGENYLGINGLFTNILTVLSLAELGIGGAIVYSMYKPIAENDYDYLSALINYYKKLYRIIGLSVCAVGLLLVPLLKYIVNLDADIGNVTFFYLLYLANTVSSYFLIYKSSILIADQKNYIIKLCHLTVNVIKFIVLSIIAVIFKNFYLYLSIQIVFSIIGNYVCSKEAEKRYPFINKKIELSRNDKKGLWNNVTHMFTYQLGYVVLNNTDNILISAMVSTTAVGFYSNYSMIISEINMLIQLLFSAFQASIGNLGTEKNTEKQYEVFKTVSLFSFIINYVFSVALICVFQDVIDLLFTNHFVLEYKIVIVCVFNFYVYNMLQPVYSFRNTIGLFKNTKTIMIYTSAINIVLSIIFGEFMGLFGILLATGISRLVTNIWYEPLKLFKIYLKKPIRYYYFTQVALGVFTLMTMYLMFFLTKKIHLSNLFIQLLLKGVIAVIIPMIVCFILFRKKIILVFQQYKDVLKNKR